ncbi:MAG TPA: RagB/SusD family nutrient uptake outer membrane protein [Pedobacter sp.]|nr:RagB/SusD family nutrient uptake outer membrane protein [Pedobacter sp.]
MKRDLLKSNFTAVAAVKSAFNKLFLLTSLSLLFLLGSCEVLDQEPQSEVRTDLAISNQQSAKAALAGMYNQLQDANYYGRNLLIMGDVTSDIAQSIGSWDFYREMDTYLVSLDNRENGAFYTRAYRAVSVANSLIATVPSLSDMTDASKDAMLGQAYFVRGLAYFDLAKVYGGIPGVYGTLGVPLVLTPTTKVDESIFVARAGLQETYDQAEKDLLKALELLPAATNRSQASKGTARALLSRLYLYENKPAQVLTYADLVISDPSYILAPSFAAIFESKLSTEAILELNFNSVDQSNIRNWYFPASGGGRGDIAAHTEFYEAAIADPKDTRGKLFAYSASSKTYYPTRYMKAGNIDNVLVIRIAEIYLNRAEARAKTNDLDGARADLNKVRKRAGVDEINPVGEEAVLKAIWMERKLELAFEGHSFFDQVRTGLSFTELASVKRTNGPAVSLVNPGRQVFPIPSFEMSSNNKLSQNEAYK